MFDLQTACYFHYVCLNLVDHKVSELLTERLSAIFFLRKVNALRPVHSHMETCIVTFMSFRLN